MATASLIGVREVSLEELRSVPCPAPEGRWVPVAHHTVVEHVLDALREAQYGIRQVHFGLHRGDQRLFGTAVLDSQLVHGVQLAVGFRSSYDRSIALHWCIGHHVMVCSNMAFHSTKGLEVARLHTINGVLRYREAIQQAVSHLPEFAGQQAAMIRALATRELDDARAESYLLRCYLQGILSPRTIEAAVKEWREPGFAEFNSRTAWSLFNAVTRVIGDRRKTNPQAHAAMTIRLGALLMGQDSIETP